ncbi:hypothetical protein CHGG_04604 [Chaetomium globosum CBS 148.51]|uniref:DUF2415 domain-containing protein n=1 Tax=Chaetomium globosum (strain ATCC 6205 / CBS 148.51 / DSM 1962 / NBRC 6347 / NRRL 1970) TaxID=306901 RepID=Q2H0U2_CHAGB|nr:uncharacterized protein CHGG_04604 [Chaetomium globosum CBS 148.51]EAQ87985.1 hypothetical protein CHGG_04604 [Chaetomium globosum CBS 148.51]
MAVSTNLYTPTEDLILANPRRRFETGLRSLIGTDGQHFVYFPVPGSDNRSCSIQRLNAKTRETETIKRLHFNPRCLVARNGWVCCGGESGLFSAFRVDDRNPRDGAERRPDLQADDRLPLSLDLLDATSSALAETRAEKNLVAQSTGFGKDRVNCITLWFPPTVVEPSEGAYDQDVAVLAHNDSSVVVVSLRDQKVLDKITYPDYMNRGVISPDGRLLVAISDDPYLYIHERKEKRPENGTTTRATGRPVGSFAACFSSTGQYLAVGTQYGTISIFNVAALTVSKANALMTAFSASRPNAEFGAVRDMAFSPGPVDLLAWTEDRGRVGVADIRTGFDSRQILYLDKDNDFEGLTVIDRGTIDPRLLEQRTDRNEYSLEGFSAAAGSNAENQASRSEDQAILSRYNIPLTAEETGVLEAIQDFRRRQDQYGAAGNRTNTENNGSNTNNNPSNNTSNNPSNNSGAAGGSATSSRPPPWAERSGRAAENARGERTASVSRTVIEILENIRDQRERIRDTHERLRTREDNTAERRRYAASPLSGLNTALGPAGSGAVGRSALVSRLMANTTNPASPASWDNVEALYDPSPSGNVPRETVPSRTVDSGPSANPVRRYRAAYLMREWDENPTRRTLGSYMTAHSRPGPNDTAGLSWSENGHSLFVGAESGIYEFSVNLFGRRLSPTITFS